MLQADEKTCPDLGHQDAVGYAVDERMDGLLTTLASVVVDELITLRNSGMEPAAIKALYEQELPQMPVMRPRQRRQRKD